MAACKHEHKHQEGQGEEHAHHHHHGDANHFMNQSSMQELVERFEGGDRDEWQKPDEVIAMLQVDSNSTWMENDIKGLFLPILILDLILSKGNNSPFVNLLPFDMSFFF